jgi:hypothetical protein
MKTIAKLMMVAASMAGLAAVGCASKHEDGVKSTYRSQYSEIVADTVTTTNAAKAVLEAEGLKDVTASSTNADGKATAKKADGTEITVDVEKADAGSKLRINVGMLGDPKYGAELAAKIKAKAEMK